MEEPFEQFVKKIKENNKVVTHKDQSGENEIQQYYSSCFIEGKGVFVKGESCNRYSAKRNAMIILFKKGTDQIIGKMFQFFLWKENNLYFLWKII